MQSVADIDFAVLAARGFHPSPAAWEDQALYFFMLDRFSDGNETDYVGNDGFLVTRPGTPRYFGQNDFDRAVGNAATSAAWRDAGGRFVGGTLKGATSKIGYLARLGITAIWVSPVFRQPQWAESYHGYGVQDFLAIEPRFGTADDPRELVATAHIFTPASQICTAVIHPQSDGLLRATSWSIAEWPREADVVHQAPEASCRPSPGP